MDSSHMVFFWSLKVRLVEVLRRMEGIVPEVAKSLRMPIKN